MTLIIRVLCKITECVESCLRELGPRSCVGVLEERSGYLGHKSNNGHQGLTSRSPGPTHHPFQNRVSSLVLCVFTLYKN